MPASYLPQNLQRVGFLAAVPAILRRYGVDPVKVLAEAGLSANALDDPEATIRYEQMGHLVELAANRTRCPHFGLVVGALIRTSSLGVAGELMRNAPTLGDALRDFAAHQHRNAHGSVVYLTTDRNKATFGYAIYRPRVLGGLIIRDGAAMAAFNIFRELASTDDNYSVEVLFSRSEPLDLAPYHSAFGVTLCFNSDQTAVCFPAELLDQPIVGANEARRRNLERRLEALWYAGELDIVTKLRRLLRHELLAGPTSNDTISDQLGMSRRTLNRRLSAHGLKFQQVLNETRYEFAEQLLAHTNLDIHKIGKIVGYADPSIFTRGFTHWAGVSPSEWRAITARAIPMAQTQTAQPA